MGLCHWGLYRVLVEAMLFSGMPARMRYILLLAAAAINLKRLTSRPPAAAHIRAKDNTAARAHLAILNACLRALAADAATTSTTGS